MCITMIETVILVAVCFIFGILFWNWLQKAILRTKIINRIPGPDGQLIVGVLLDFLRPPEDIWKYVRKLGNGYYPIYKYWFGHIPVINFVCPEDIEILLSTTKHTRKGPIYDLLHPWLGTGLLTSEGSKWQTRRKILTPAFHFNILQQFLAVFKEESEQLTQQLENECNKPYTNVVPFITQFTLRSICETAMGAKVEQEHEKGYGYTQEIIRMGELIIYRLMRPWFHSPTLFMVSSRYREQKRTLGSLHAFSKSVIEKRKVNFKEPSDLVPTKRRLAMLDLLISAKNSGQAIDDEGMREEVDTFMFEGHDTTAACISFTLLLLANNLEIQQKIVQELNEILGDNNHIPTIQDLQSLRYLDMVLKESLRIYPSVPYISRITDEEFCTHTGYTIPANSVIQVHIFDMHHNPELYPNPSNFDPDRFLPENQQGRHPFAYLPFSAGPRNCIGQKFAFLEIKTVVSAILRKFSMTSVDKPSDIVHIVDLVMRARDGIKIKFQRRIK